MSQTVYPRWRGEHIEEIEKVEIPTGLSPLARGTLRNADVTTALHRFIPAGAGNTTHPLLLDFLIAVYPRWRGEHRFSITPR
ncbi:hypothetical protein FORC098_1057 [Salmonella enterica subsp. enterica serovar Typhimurium]|nr:hypothetical protein FORC098_1057 [Salmonella enterica subsp. enterica serovar Typhimurium]